jgi:hypothetical protein
VKDAVTEENTEQCFAIQTWNSNTIKICDEMLREFGNTNLRKAFGFLM